MADNIQKLEDTITVNETKFPEIFELSEQEVLKTMNAVIAYINLESYQDWVKMYNDIHRESTIEATTRHWLACFRWMKKK